MKTYSDPTGPGWTIEDQLANAVRELLAVVEYYEHRTKDPITGRKDDWPAKYQAREALKRREQAARKAEHERDRIKYFDPGMPQEIKYRPAPIPDYEKAISYDTHEYPQI